MGSDSEEIPLCIHNSKYLQLTVRLLKKYNDYWRVINYSLIWFTDMAVSVFNF